MLSLIVFGIETKLVVALNVFFFFGLLTSTYRECDLQVVPLIILLFGLNLHIIVDYHENSIRRKFIKHSENLYARETKKKQLKNFYGSFF